VLASPGYGDLAVLLEEAALLEKKLSEGNLPDEHDMPRRNPPESTSKLGAYQDRMRLGARANSSTGVSPERGRPSLHRTSTSLSIHASPLRSSSRKRSREPAMPPPTGALPSIPTSDRKGRAAESAETQYASRREYVDELPPNPPPKSPFPRYIASLRRLAGGSHSPMAMPGAYPRHSASTSSEISSEDSIPVATPPDHTLEFGSVSSSDHSMLPGSGTGLGVGAWPSGSPKKNLSLTRVSSRASSFAEKLWNNRKRTKSTTSSADTCGDSIIDEPTPRQTTPVAYPPPAPHYTIPPMRSSSLISDGRPPSRSMSWASLESPTSTTSSPLFDKEIYDAFPSVPQDSHTLLSASLTRPELSLPKTATLPSSDSQATTPTDVMFNVSQLSPSNIMPLRPRMNSMKKAIAEKA